MKGEGTRSEQGNVTALCEQLLELADREQRAVSAGSLDELEWCLRRKEELVERLRNVGVKDMNAGFSGLATLIEQVLDANVGVARGIAERLEECRRAILAVRAGQRAELAYQESRRQKRQRSAKVL